MNREAARTAARAALVGAMEGDWDAVSVAIAEINGLGGEASEFAIRAWCDSLIARRPFRGYDGPDAVAGLVLVNSDDGNLSDVDAVPPEVAWAGRIITARAAGDYDGYKALIEALPEDGYEIGHWVTTLLQIVAQNVNAIAAGSHPSQAQGEPEAAPDDGAFDDEAASKAASEVLEAAIAEDRSEVEAATTRLVALGGPAVGFAMAAWADALADKMRAITGGNPGALVVQSECGHAECQESAPDRYGWAAQFIDARANRDLIRAELLIMAIPPDRVAGTVTGLLYAVAGNLRRLRDGSHPNQADLC